MSTRHAREHRRVYQACEPCREKKVRCELGSTDNPNKPPCARCRRESKQCFFAASRIRKNGATKRKAQSPLVEELNRPQPAIYLPGSTYLPRSTLNHAVQEAERQTPTEDGRAAAALLEGHPRTYHDALTLLSETCEHMDNRTGLADRAPLVNHPPNGRLNPANSPLGAHADTNTTDKGTNAALRAWSKLRFVRGGLFTAEEALDMVDYFYNSLSAFSPVVPECFRDHSQHATLIEQEPILTITILMIGSRYRKWTGPAAVARSYIVHDRDFFVGEIPSLRDPFIGSARAPQPPYAGDASHGFRTLGTCEALLLLLDWHPRDLHFPPPDEDSSSIVVSEPKRPRKTPSVTGYDGPGSGHDWLARSDRLCHSMLSTVLMLATEMGIFCENYIFRQDDRVRHDSSALARDQERCHRIRCLMWVYSTLQPGQPGRKVPIPFPPTVSASIKIDDTTECWMRVAIITKNANELLFVSPTFTGEIIRNGQYLPIVRGLEPKVNNSIAQFDRAKLAKQTRYILTIEYEYAKLCIFSVTLQAVINRHHRDGTSGRLDGCCRGASTEEQRHLRGTVEASQSILRTVLDDIHPDGGFTYMPVRSYSRLLGATLILLKCCAAGISEIDIPMAFDLVQRVAVGLRSSVIDDIHLGTRWGDLLENLTRRLQSRLGHPNTPKGSGAGRPSGATPSNTYGETSQAFPETEPSTISLSTQDQQASVYPEHSDILDVDRPSSGDARRDTQFDTLSMWWDNAFSQVNLNYMPWYPTLGLMDGIDPACPNDAGTVFESGGPTHGA
ncbi:uncharacterized protein N7515_008867 [Penicillium bovifimosum]|uniref:Zn(2)-C6 fungal-type domain-containing protein n=1 Tax=Penicillium bovifimosum TaxID=126998 RepID=A0A9W9GQ23_9EURO|nr:uncharacterized protein N7515_008867 [Penicillium bovifimosum]KAJ5125042.1 hypothetical protein N7515_008867 [Penicillium bovifimosum]